MKGKAKIILYTVIFTILLTVVSIYVQRKAIHANPQITVYKAARDFDIGDSIKSSDLVPYKVDLTEDVVNYIKSKSDVTNKIVKQHIYKGEYLNIKRLTDKNDPNVFISDNTQRFSIPVSYIDDPYSLTFRKGDVVDIIFTEMANSGSSGKAKSEVVLPKAIVVGAIDQNGALLTEKDKNKLATAILFESTTGNILTISEDQYKGKFKFTKYPDNN